MTMDSEETPAPDPGPSTSQESGSAPCEKKASESTLSSQRVFKKSSQNSKLTMYLATRDLVVSHGRIDRLTGVLLVDPEFVENRKVFGQITLTFRQSSDESDSDVMWL